MISPPSRLLIQVKISQPLTLSFFATLIGSLKSSGHAWSFYTHTTLHTTACVRIHGYS